MLIMLLNVTVKLSFISSRRRQGQEDREEIMPGTVQVSVPSELVMSLLTRGAILQVQIGPVPIRPILRPASSPERPAESTPLRPNAPGEEPRPNPAGRTNIAHPRPERPVNRGPPARPVSRPPVDPFTDWSSQSDNEVISIPSSDEDDDYVPKSPLYEPNSPEPVSRPDIVDQNPRQNDGESNPTRRSGQSNNNDNEERPRSPLGRGNFLRMVSPFFRGQRKRPQLGRIRPM